MENNIANWEDWQARTIVKVEPLAGYRNCVLMTLSNGDMLEISVNRCLSIEEYSKKVEHELRLINNSKKELESELEKIQRQKEMILNEFRYIEALNSRNADVGGQ